MCAQEHFLVINPDGHRSQISCMDIDSEGKVVTGSFDKTVKVWDPNKGHLLREFRGQIGIGSEGMIYTLDVSPDNRYLAVGGWMGKDDESERLGDIRLFDYQTGKMIHLLKPVHQDAVFSVKFTNDSKHLISGSADGVMVRWEVERGLPEKVYSTLNLGFSNIAMADDYFVSTHPDGMFYKWDVDKSKPKKKIKFFKKIEELSVTSIAAVSADGECISVAGKEVGMILIFNKRFSLKDYFFTGNNEVVNLSLSPDGKRLAACIKQPSNNRAVIYEKQGKKWQEICSYKGHDAATLNVRFLDNNTVVSTGGFKDEIAIWEIKKENAIEKRKIIGVGQTYFSAGLTGTKLVYGLVPNRAYGLASYSNGFDLFKREHLSGFDSADFRMPKHKRGDFELYEEEPVRKKDWDPSEILYLKKGDKELAKIERYPWSGNRHRSYTFIDDKFIVSGGDYGMLVAYDYEGNVVSRFVGHEGSVSSVNLSDDNKFVVTAAYDNTIRLWRREEIGKHPRSTLLNSMWDYLEDQYLSTPWHSRILKIDMKEEAQEKTPEAVETLLKSVSQVEQHSSLPQEPIPPNRAASCRIPICFISTLILNCSAISLINCLKSTRSSAV